MEQQPPTLENAALPVNPTTTAAPPVTQWPYAPNGQDNAYGPYYPPTVPAQPAYGAKPARASQPARMPKAEALAITSKLKALLIAGSVMALGVLTALAAGHVTGVTASAAGSNNASNTSASGPSSQNVPTNNTGSDDGGFFNQAPSNNANGGGFGATQNAPYQQPITGSSVS